LSESGSASQPDSHPFANPDLDSDVDSGADPEFLLPRRQNRGISQRIILHPWGNWEKAPNAPGSGKFGRG
jgi:hypothetical protein